MTAVDEMLDEELADTLADARRRGDVSPPRGSRLSAMGRANAVTTEAVQQNRLKSLETRRHVTDSGCWEWTGSLALNGYGQYRTAETSLLVHRLAYELYIGPIPDGLIVHHRCENRSCFNPEHLLAMTTAEHTSLHQSTEACPRCGGTNRRQKFRHGRKNGRCCEDCRNRKRRRNPPLGICSYCGAPAPESSVCVAHSDLPRIDPTTGVQVTTATTERNH